MRGNHATLGLREIINARRRVFLTAAILMVMGAALYAIYMYKAEPLPKGDKALYTVDDGQTWFVDSIYKTPPFDHDGKVAVRALVYSYDKGRQRFCPLVERYTSETKKTLDDAVAEATREGRPLSSIQLFNMPSSADGMEVKLAGPDHDWVRRSDVEESAKILNSVKAPDGGAVDFVIP